MPKIMVGSPTCGIGVPVWEIMDPPLLSTDFLLRIQISGKGLFGGRRQPVGQYQV